MGHQFFCSAGINSGSGNYQLRQRESVQTVLKLQIIIILISYIIIYISIKLLINENHPGRNQKRNLISLFSIQCLWTLDTFLQCSDIIQKPRQVINALCYKNITIVNDTSRVIIMTIVSDGTIWSVTYIRQSCSQSHLLDRPY